jgi:tetraacyldisaccharide 4'-kinase
MNFNFYLLKSFRILLFPFAFIYGVIIYVRNFLYKKNILKSVKFNLPIICVGNLSVGGTGKSPMVEYLVGLLKNEYKIATLSRGYKRKTKGYALAMENTNALQIGDEPMQFHMKFPEVAVAVGEERIVAIPQLLHDRPETQAIILDDAFQHRAIEAGLNIVLTDYNNLFTRDFFLPMGDLRDQRASYKRAQVIVVTKCPATLTENEKKKLVAEINPIQGQHVFFTSIVYGEPYHIISQQVRKITTNDEVLLICGIANPKPLQDYILNQAHSYEEHLYSDHYIFRIDDLRDMKSRLEKLQAENRMIITTEKDAVRLLKFEKELTDLPVYVIPVKHSFLFNEGKKFDALLHQFIKEFFKDK